MSAPAARFRPLLLVSALSVASVFGFPARGALKAGAYAQDVTPTEFPVLVNGGFTEVAATKVVDPLFARATVLDDGRERIALVIVDSCMLPRELLDDAKGRAQKLTGIAPDKILISATHTHSAPSAMGALGTDEDPKYVNTLPDLLARSIAEANKRLAPAKIGHAVVHDPDHNAVRRWVFRPDRMRNDPFGELTVRANMHPGHLSPDAIGPTGPSDPGLSLVSIQHPDGRPLALLANYSMHYVGSSPVSADYFGRFAAKVAKVVNGDDAFVGAMSQGTSGDLWLADYSKPAPPKRPNADQFADAMVAHVARVYPTIRHTDDAPISMRETTLKLRRRVPDEKRLAWAKEKVAALGDKKPKNQRDVYAREAILLHAEPERELKLQAIRVGQIAIAAMPNEVFALTGLKIKAQSPLPTTFNVSLANGSEGYIPPPEQHKLGGYTTWPARTAALEPQAEPKIVEATLKLLEAATGKPRRPVVYPAGAYAKAVLASNPAAYYRLAEMAGPRAYDASPNNATATYEAGVVFHLPGPGATGLTADATPTRAAHFAGGRLLADLERFDPKNYTVEFWFWNGLAETARPVTAYLFSRGPSGNNDLAPGDHLGVGGTHDNSAHAGRLIFFTGNERSQILTGKTALHPRTWYHVALTRTGDTITAHLNGQPELTGQAPPTSPATSLFLGGRCDNFANLEGKLAEVAVYTKPLTADEIQAHYSAAQAPTPSPKAANNPPSPRPASAVGEGRGEGSSPPANAPPRNTQFKRTADPRSPEDSLKSLHLRPDLSAQIVAAEPLTASPVAIDWAPDGRLWVVEMADYPYGMDGKGKPGGRVRILTDTDHDGVYDQSSLFLDNLAMPTGLLVWRDGVLITAAPDILFARDIDNDGKADKTEVLFTGFKTGNPQLRVNGLRFGLDNWVYCASGLSAGLVKSTKTGQTLDLKNHDLRIRPDDGQMELVAGMSQFGREQDDVGRWFGTHNARPLFHYALEARYLTRNPHATYPDAQVHLLPLPLPPLHPKSPFAKRYIGLDHHGHFTSACGISIYRDDLLFHSPSGNPQSANPLHAFICSPVHNLVQHQVLSEDGATFKATRQEGAKGADFLASEDPWFRPVQTRTGPDGALWIVDMYRFMIEHPDWLNDQGKSELAPFYRDGDDRGRIYRVYPKGKKPRPIPNLTKLTTAHLVATLESPSGHTRDLAQRLLHWRLDAEAVPLLDKLARESASPLARLHALYTLSALTHGARPDITALKSAAADPDAAVRLHACRLLEPWLRDSPDAVESIAHLPDDPSPFVRQQLAYTLGQSTSPNASGALARLAADPRSTADPSSTAAIVSSALPHFRALVATKPSPTSPVWPPLLKTAVATADRASIATLLGPAPEPGRAREEDFRATAVLLDTLAASKTSLDKLSTAPDALSDRLHRLDALFDDARRTAGAADTAPAPRLAALDLLGRQPDRCPDDLAVLRTLFTPRQPGDVQLATIRAAARTADPAVADLLLAPWASLTPNVQGAAADVLLSREPWALKLATTPNVPLDFSRRQRLLNHPSAKVKAAANEHHAQSAQSADRQKVIDDYQPALTLAGDAKRGQALYGEHCATCHRVGQSTAGQELGPNLLTVRDWTKENLLTAILDPDRSAEPRYLAYTATLEGGTTHTGLLIAESAASITIKTLDAAEHPLPRAGLKSLVSTNHSLMPQGFESALEPQDVADLITFIQNPTP
jgi:putative membrane-bound dehydrogenase-like protein